jgi:hypothetical protein
MMKTALSLSDEQVQRIAPMMKERQAKLQALRKDGTLSRHDRAARIRAIREASQAKVNAVLTPEQARKWRGPSAPSPKATGSTAAPGA